MAEVLGVLASASQLVQYTLKISAAISAIHDRVQNAPELRKGAEQVKQLLDTAIQIKHNPQVHDSSLFRHLASATEEAKQLLELLERLSGDYSNGSLSKRYYKAARGAKYENKIATGFRRLEQEKTSLLFCIGVANTERLSSIQIGVTGIADRMSSSRVVEAVRINERFSGGNGINELAGSLAIIPRQPQTYLQDDSTAKEQQQSTGNSQGSDQHYAPERQSEAFANGETSYENCFAVGENDEAKQLNGHIGNPSTAKATYKNCTAMGKASQLNGSVGGGVEGFAFAQNFFSNGRS